MPSKATFTTSDGYTLKLIDDVWTDGDLTFRNRSHWPIDHNGEPLEGQPNIADFEPAPATQEAPLP